MVPPSLTERCQEMEERPKLGSDWCSSSGKVEPYTILLPRPETILEPNSPTSLPPRPALSASFSDCPLISRPALRLPLYPHSYIFGSRYLFKSFRHKCLGWTDHNICPLDNTFKRLGHKNRCKEACDMIFVHLIFVLVIFVIIFVPLLSHK